MIPFRAAPFALGERAKLAYLPDVTVNRRRIDLLTANLLMTEKATDATGNRAKQ